MHYAWERMRIDIFFWDWIIFNWLLKVRLTNGYLGCQGDDDGERHLLVQVNLCQKLLFLHQLTHNMTTDCSLNYKFNSWKFQAQTWGEHVAYRNCFWHSEQFLYATCSPHVLQKEELLTKIYLYHKVKFWGRCMW